MVSMHLWQLVVLFWLNYTEWSYYEEIRPLWCANNPVVIYCVLFVFMTMLCCKTFLQHFAVPKVRQRDVVCGTCKEGRAIYVDTKNCEVIWLEKQKQWVQGWTYWEAQFSYFSLGLFFVKLTFGSYYKTFLALWQCWYKNIQLCNNLIETQVWLYDLIQW